MRHVRFAILALAFAFLAGCTSSSTSGAAGPKAPHPTNGDNLKKTDDTRKHEPTTTNPDGKETLPQPREKM
jgi:hypothetical protein